MDIGGNLRKVRSKKDFSQQEAADFLGVDRRTYIDWEDGKTDIKVSNILKLAEFFQVEVDELIPKKSGDIVISQHNTENKDTSTNNSIVFIITDKDTIDQVFNVIKPMLKKETSE